MTARCEYCDTRLPDDSKSRYCNEFCKGSTKRGRIHPKKIASLLAPLRAIAGQATTAEFSLLWAWRNLCTLRTMIAAAPAAERQAGNDAIIDLLLDYTQLREAGQREVAKARAKWEAERAHADQELEDGIITELPDYLKEPIDEPPGAA